MSINDFEVIKEIGKGAFAKVYLVKRKSDNLIYALKIVKITSLNIKERENTMNEVRILASIYHPNLIGFKECFFDEDSNTVNIIMEYADDGDIENKILEYKSMKKTFPEDKIWSYLIQILFGLKKLHDNNIMHRDLKSANIFLTKDGKIKLGDFNVSKFLQRGMTHTQTGTPYYASPEVWAEKPYNQKSDIWSIGCIIYEMCSLKPPFLSKTLDGLYKSITKGNYENIPKEYSSDLSKIISYMLEKNQYKRPNCCELLNLKIIKNIISASKDLNYLQEINNKNTLQIEKNVFKVLNYRNLNDIKCNLPKETKYILNYIEETNSNHNKNNISIKNSSNQIIDIFTKKRSKTPELKVINNGIINTNKRIISGKNINTNNKKNIKPISCNKNITNKQKINPKINNGILNIHSKDNIPKSIIIKKEYSIKKNIEKRPIVLKNNLKDNRPLTSKIKNPNILNKKNELSSKMSYSNLRPISSKQPLQSKIRQLNI